MRWYQGNIAEAVSASKKNGAVFVVYVEGKDNKSQEFSHLIESEEVSKHLEKEYFVAIKIEENSVPHQQFSQIYNQVTVPSLFFIGKTGAPLEIVKDTPHTTSDFLNKLQNILQKNGTNVTISSANAASSETFIKKEQDQQKSEAVCENGVIPQKDVPSTSKAEPEESENAASNNLSQEEKIERAQEILNQKRETKRVEEEQAARVKEIERRKVGQDVQKLKRWQQEQELKELMDERNKEKKEKQEARQRVLAQIAQDKAERAAKFANTSQNNQQPQISPQPTRRAPVNSNTARLQFKLPDGASHMHDFPSNNTLQDVRNYIISNINLPFQYFTLSTTFPRREFTADNSTETLLELELVPNAVILILPVQHGAVTTNSDSWIMTMFWSLIGPILNLVGYLRSKLFGSATPNPTPPPSNVERKRPIESPGETSNIPKKRSGETSVVRRGNVHRLTDNADSDDDNNTWNGNSTQQM